MRTDTAIVLSQIADDQIFTEMKKDYAKEMVTGFIRLNGMTVGAVANRTKVYAEDGTEAASFDCALTVDGCKKAVDFVHFCDAFSIPVLTLTNVEGFSATLDSEKDMARAVARMTYAFAEATVPKVNVIIGNAYGSAEHRDEQQINRCGHGICMGKCKDRYDGCKPCWLVSCMMTRTWKHKKKAGRIRKKSNPVLNQRLQSDTLMRSSRLPIRENM